MCVLLLNKSKESFFYELAGRGCSLRNWHGFELLKSASTESNLVKGVATWNFQIFSVKNSILNTEN